MSQFKTAMSQFKTIGIMLAAGSSRRMGTDNKLLCQINNTTILEHSLNNFAQSKLKEIILVLGHEAETIAALPVVQKLKNEKKLSIVINENYADGMGTSLSAGVAAIGTNDGGNNVDACLIALGDMPFISTKTIDKIIDAGSAEKEKAIIVPQYNGKNGHPVLWKKQFFTALSGLNKDQGAKDIIAENKTLVKNISVDDKGVIQDVDTPETLDSFKV